MSAETTLKFQKITVSGNVQDQVGVFAVQELEALLAAQDGKLSGRIHFLLRTDPGLEDGSFSILATGSPDTQLEIALRGSDSTSVLHALYTVLELCGYNFEITGALAPDQLDVTRIPRQCRTTRPRVRWRGIRQHINFPMDMSSYPLDEAREYIRNLARLRYNHITFHSYPGQWYIGAAGAKLELAGHFFYNQEHQVPQGTNLSACVRNQKYFCIPEIEPCFTDVAARSEAAICWLQQVMREAKRCGFRIQFSFELRSETVQESIKLCETIQETYPEIDILELITEETGGWGNQTGTLDELKDLVIANFGIEAAAELCAQNLLLEARPQLARFVSQLGRNIAVLREIPEAHAGHLCYALGVYATPHDYLRIARHLLRTYAPPQASWALLPAHGARAVVDSLSAAGFDESDLSRAILYSWIEFDGSMYVLQNPVEGIGQLIDWCMQVNGRKQIRGIALNHWRTAENRIAARFAAEVMLNGPIPSKQFYESYAASHSFGRADEFACAMTLLDETDTRIRNELPNIGFCFLGCWGGIHDLGYAGNFARAKIESVLGAYQTVAAKLLLCRKESRLESAVSYLDFLINRTECSTIHLHVLEELTELQPVSTKRKHTPLTPVDRTYIESICNRAMGYAKQYMEHHAEALPDRGCEGTLISYYHTLPAYIARIMKQYCGMQEQDSNYIDPIEDQPPPPVI